MVSVQKQKKLWNFIWGFFDFKMEINTNQRRLSIITVKGGIIDKSKGDIFEGCPSSWVCPISQTVPKNPVIASDGHLYGMDEILKWCKTCSRPVSPITKEFLEPYLYVPMAIRNDIHLWVEEKKKNRLFTSDFVLDPVGKMRCIPIPGHAHFCTTANVSRKHDGHVDIFLNNFKHVHSTTDDSGDSWMFALETTDEIYSHESQG